MAYEELKETNESHSVSSSSTNSDAIHDHGRDYQISDDGEFF